MSLVTQPFCQLIKHSLTCTFVYLPVALNMLQFIPVYIGINIAHYRVVLFLIAIFLKLTFRLVYVMELLLQLREQRILKQYIKLINISGSAFRRFVSNNRPDYEPSSIRTVTKVSHKVRRDILGFSVGCVSPKCLDTKLPLCSCDKL